MKHRIVVSAVCVFDDAGRLLTVRKRGTTMFMHPGGKPGAGETAVQAAARELEEEVGIGIDPRQLRADGGMDRRRRQRGRHGHRGHRVHGARDVGRRIPQPRSRRSAGWTLPAGTEPFRKPWFGASGWVPALRFRPTWHRC